MNIADYIIRIKMMLNDQEIAVIKHENPKRLQANLHKACRRRHIKWRISVDRDSVIVAVKKIK